MRGRLVKVLEGRRQWRDSIWEGKASFAPLSALARAQPFPLRDPDSPRQLSLLGERKRARDWQSGGLRFRPGTSSDLAGVTLRRDGRCLSFPFCKTGPAPLPFVPCGRPRCLFDGPFVQCFCVPAGEKLLDPRGHRIPSHSHNPRMYR